MKTHYLLLSILILLPVIISAQQRPNILWINGDDLGTELSCYGNPDVFTPNIDDLAKQGLLFTKAYANAPICSTSRSSMITGMYPTTINCQDHRTINMTKLPEGIEPITAYFKKAGYFCSNGSGMDMKKKGKEDFNFLNDGLFDGADWNQRKDGQAFFAQVQIKYPHRTFVEDTIHPVDAESVKLPGSYPDHPLIRADWALYLESVQQFDKIVGEILQRLEDEGLADNTIVFLFGDHGRPHLRDKQFLYEGGLKIPLIIRYPDNIKGGKKTDQLVSLVDVAATSLNMAGIEVPEYMHGKVFLGKGSVERKYVYGFRQRAGDAPDNIRSITDGHYKLIWNRMPDTPWMQLSSYKKSQYVAFTLYRVLDERGELKAPYKQFMALTRPDLELYDLKEDPDEFNNLAEDEKYKRIKEELFSNLKDNMPEFEKNMIAEQPETIRDAKEASSEYLEKSFKQRGLKPDVSDEDLLKYWEHTLLKN